MASHRFIAASLCLMFSGGLFADWQVQYQKPNGTWANSYLKKTEADARHFAGIACLGSRAPIKIVDTDSGKEHALHCDTRTGKITADGKPAPVVLMTESEAGARASEVSRLCQANAFINNVADCGCVEERAKAEALQNEARVGADAILKKVGDQCPDQARVQAWTYESCTNVMKTQRPDDFERFCRCTADSTAAGFMKKPVVNVRYYESLRNEAMKQCGLGKKAG